MAGRRRTGLAELIAALDRYLPRDPLGEDQPGQRPPIALGQRPELGAAPRDLRIHLAAADPAPPAEDPLPPLSIEIADTLLPALLGPSTPLPLAMIERAGRGDRHGLCLREFLDLFYHRLVTRRIRGRIHFLAPLGGDDAELWQERLVDALGLHRLKALPAARRRLLLAPLLGAGGRHTPGLLCTTLEIALGDLADDGLRVTSDHLVANTSRIPTWARAGLGAPTARLGGTGAGSTVVLGEHLRVREGLRIHLRHLPVAALPNFRVGGPGHRRIAELVDLLAPPQHPWSLEIHPKDPRQGCARLGEAVLGSSWLPYRASPPTIPIPGQDYQAPRGARSTPAGATSPAKRSAPPATSLISPESHSARGACGSSR